MEWSRGMRRCLTPWEMRASRWVDGGGQFRLGCSFGGCGDVVGGVKNDGDGW